MKIKNAPGIFACGLLILSGLLSLLNCSNTDSNICEDSVANTVTVTVNYLIKAVLFVNVYTTVPVEGAEIDIASWKKACGSEMQIGLKRFQNVIADQNGYYRFSAKYSLNNTKDKIICDVSVGPGSVAGYPRHEGGVKTDVITYDDAREEDSVFERVVEVICTCEHN
jgi:hypothetical protein